MSTRSMSLAGVRIPYALPIAVTFAPCDTSHLPSKYRKLDRSKTKDPSPESNRKNSVPLPAEEREIKAGFCCPHHRELFNQDFDSEDEGMSRKIGRRPGKLSFLSEIPFEAKHHLMVRRDLRDAETQHEEVNQPLLSDLASWETVPSEGALCYVVQTKEYAGPCHMAEYTQAKIPATALWNQFPEVPVGEKCPIECPHCSQRFTSGQALGGHTSRRHSNKRPTHPHKRLRRLNSTLDED